ncbi:MAG TPA: CAP domain-containing protein [Thermoanaerobaculia bacterium]|nr:CAP domain-containing protein [Thermoanaerobaculia bacterium]
MRDTLISSFSAPRFVFSVRLSLGILALSLTPSLTEARPTSYESLRERIREELLDEINNDRVAARLAPVVLDPQASTIADQYCEQQVRDRSTGHFSLTGLSPYMRYSLGGGYDGLNENTAAWSANYDFAAAAVPALVLRSHRTMVSEAPPADGHRRTILDPLATHVGLGFAWHRGEVRMAEEFLRRYVGFLDALPRHASLSSRLTLRGKPISGYEVSAVTIHFEKHPRPISRRAAARISGYGLPTRRRDYRPRLATTYARNPGGMIVARSDEYIDGKNGDFSVAQDGTFAFPIPFRDGIGVYTVVVWVAKRGGGEAFPVSNISIFVSSRETSHSRSR